MRACEKQVQGWILAQPTHWKVTQCKDQTPAPCSLCLVWPRNSRNAQLSCRNTCYPTSLLIRKVLRHAVDRDSPYQWRIRTKTAFDTPTLSKELSGWDNTLSAPKRTCIVPAKCEALARLEETRPFDSPEFERASGQRDTQNAKLTMRGTGQALYFAVMDGLVQNTKPAP